MCQHPGRQSLMRLRGGQSNPKMIDRLSSQQFRRLSQRACRSGNQRNAESRRSTRSHEHRSPPQTFVPRQRPSRSPRPINIAHQPLHKLAKFCRNIPAVDRRPENDGVRSIDLLQDRIQIIPLHASTTFYACFLSTSPAIRAKLKMFFPEVNSVCLSAIFARAVQNRLHRSIDRPALAIAAHDRHNFTRHSKPPIDSAISVVPRKMQSNQNLVTQILLPHKSDGVQPSPRLQRGQLQSLP